MNYLTRIVLVLVCSLTAAFTGPGLIDVAPRYHDGIWDIEIISLSECEVVDIEVTKDNDSFEFYRTNQHHIFLRNVQDGTYRIKATNKCTGLTEVKTVTIPN